MKMVTAQSSSIIAENYDSVFLIKIKGTTLPLQLEKY